jgi:hypothetical protein
MIEKQAFQTGMARLGEVFSVPMTEEKLDVFASVLSPKLSTEQWNRAVTRAIEAETFFPPPAVLLRFGLADGSLSARAGESLQRILRHFEKGERLGDRQVQELYGHAAAEAFMAAGGSGRFEWCEPSDVPFRLKAFVAAFLEVAEVDPVGALKGGSNGGEFLEGQQGGSLLGRGSQEESD